MGFFLTMLTLYVKYIEWRWVIIWNEQFVGVYLAHFITEKTTVTTNLLNDNVNLALACCHFPVRSQFVTLLWESCGLILITQSWMASVYCRYLYGNIFLDLKDGSSGIKACIVSLVLTSWCYFTVYNCMCLWLTLAPVCSIRLRTDSKFNGC